MNYIKPIKVIEVTQPIGTFYIGSIMSSDLLNIANKNLSRYQNIESGLQRDRSPSQLKSIKKYIERPDAAFPNTIIINVGYDDSNNPNWDFDEKMNVLLIKNERDAVNVIDGQHRLFGLEGVENFELPVSIFLGLPFPEQGMIFASINSNQRSVDSSLVYELYGLSSKRLEETVSYKITSALNSELSSPWHNKIKMLGKAKNNGDISQGAFSKYIHTHLIAEKKVMRTLYEKEKDDIIYKILFDFFNAIKTTFPEAWENKNSKFILTKTTGFNGFMSFLIDVAKISKINDFPLNQMFFEEKFEIAKNNFKEFTNAEYPSGAIGQNKIRDILRSTITIEEINLLGSD